MTSTGAQPADLAENRFGFEWDKYHEILPVYEEQFKRWIEPFTYDDLAGKRILDGGCGTGRNSHWPLQHGAASVVSFDVDPRTVAVARRNLSQYENAEVLQASLYEIPFENEFDFAYSIGVIHHLAEPEKAMAQLVKAVKPGGTVCVWVYAREGHTGLKTAINNLRKLTCRMPLPLLNLLVKPFSFLWFAYLRIVPQKHPYNRMLAESKFWHLHSIVFDQLLPEIANYWTREETLALFDGLPVEEPGIQFCNQGSWTVWARKTSQPESHSA